MADRAMIRAALFDVYGTCVDWRTGVASAASRLLADKGLDPALGTAIADDWRARYDPAMEEVRSGRRTYVPLDVLQRENLDTVLAALDIEDALPPDDRDRLNTAWDALPAWPDTAENLTRIAAVMPIAACSNGSVAMMTRLAAHAGLPWTVICGAETAQTYKREAAVYHGSCAALGFAASDVVMVACHDDDLDAAAQCGLQTAYFPRPLEHGPDTYRPIDRPARFTYHARDFSALTRALCQAAA